MHRHEWKRWYFFYLTRSAWKVSLFLSLVANNLWKFPERKSSRIQFERRLFLVWSFKSQFSIINQIIRETIRFEKEYLLCLIWSYVDVVGENMTHVYSSIECSACVVLFFLRHFKLLSSRSMFMCVCVLSVESNMTHTQRWNRF